MLFKIQKLEVTKGKNHLNVRFIILEVRLLALDLFLQLLGNKDRSYLHQIKFNFIRIQASNITIKDVVGPFKV